MRLLDGVQTYVDGKRIGGAELCKGHSEPFVHSADMPAMWN